MDGGVDPTRDRLDPIDRLEATLLRLVSRARRARGVLVTAGPGAGASTFLARVAAHAPGQVWETAGGDTSRAIGGLARLLGDVGRIAAVPTEGRRALERVAWSRRRPGDLPVAARGLCDLVRAVGFGAPVLWVIDDADRLDAPTRAVVSSLLRDRPAAPVFVVAVTTTDDDWWWADRRIELPPPPERALRHVVADGDRISRSVADELMEVCDGNPAAAAYIGRRLRPDQKVGSVLLPDPLPIAPRLVDHAARLLREAGTDERGDLLTATAIRQAGGEVTGGDRPAWLADAVLTAADPAELRAIHHRLGACSDDESHRILHRALAAEEADDDLAAGVVRAAAAALDDGDTTTALRHYRVAFATAASPTRRSSIAVAAGTAAILAGRRGSAAAWAVRARAEHTADESAPTALEGAIRSGLGPEEQRGRLRDALAESVESPLSDFAPLAAQCLRLGVFAALDDVRGDIDRIEELYGRYEPTDGPTAHRVTRTTIELARSLATGAPDATGAVAAGTDNAVTRMHEVAEQPRVDVSGSAPTRAALYLGVLALADERWSEADELLSHAAAIEEREGWVGLHADSLAWLAELRWRQGRWDEIAGDVRRVLALPAAAGDYGAMLRAVATRAGALAQVDPVGSAGVLSGGEGIAEAIERHGLGLAALGIRDLPTARKQLEAAASIVDLRVEHPGLVTWQADLVEVLAACGLIDDAVAVLKRMEKIARRNGDGVLVAPRLRARALLRRGLRGVQLLERAAVTGCPSPFEQARTRLELARRVRLEDLDRSRHLAGETKAAFDAAGALGFAHQAQQLSRVTIDDPAVAASLLTPRGRQVAALVGAGATNAELAHRAGLSEKTVEFHLGKVFRTLSLSSRAQLSALFATEGVITP